MNFADWYLWVVDEIPNSCIDELPELDADIEIYRKWDLENEDDVLRANKAISDLRAELNKLTPPGAAANKLNSVKIKLSGDKPWLYHRPLKRASRTSHIKGKDDITYKSVEHTFPGFEMEYVKILSGENDKINWDLSKINISNNPSIFIGSIPAWQLDLVCSVPSLQKKIEHQEMARRVLNVERKKRNWQRSLNHDNQQAIASFFDRTDAFFSNPVIIHMSNKESISYDDNTSLMTVKLDFFNDEQQSISDSYEDTRPFVIIDGQHRVRGASNAIKNSNNSIPVIILPSSISEHTAGKLFSEINTLSSPLNDKHRIFLAHRFAVKSPDEDFTFGIPKESDDLGNFQRDRANRKSYELAAKLLLRSPFWEQRIKLLEQNKKDNQVIGIEKWIQFSYDWFTEYPYPYQTPYDDNHIFEEVQNYFEAWSEIIRIERWSRAKLNKCLFKSNTQSRILLRRFPQVYRLAKQVHPDVEKLSVEVFYEILSPLENIPFENLELLEIYKDGAKPEISWQILDAWVQDAIENRVTYSSEQILDTNIRGKPGRGIISKPPIATECNYELPENGLNPSEDGKTRYLKVFRPQNCRHKCSIEIWKNDEQLNNRSASWKTRTIENKENIPIRLKGPIKEETGLILRVKWQTIMGYTDIDFEIN